MIKNLPASVGDVGSIPGKGRYPGGEEGNSLQCSCLDNTVDREPVGLQSMESKSDTIEATLYASI